MRLFGEAPVLVDITLDDLTIDVNEIEKHITEKTKAIITLHLLEKLKYSQQFFSLNFFIPFYLDY